MNSIFKKSYIVLSVLLLSLICVYLYNAYFLSSLKGLGVNTYRTDFKNKSDDNSINFIVFVLIVPIIEEIFYRLGLKFSIRNTSFFILGIFYTTYLFLKPKNINFNDPIVLLQFFGTMIFGIFVIWYVVRKYKICLELIYSKYPYFVFWISVFVFAYSHFTLYQNYDNLYNIIFSPLILLPYIIAGILYGVVRIKFGLIWSCIVHILWNYIVLIINFYG